MSFDTYANFRTEVQNFLDWTPATTTQLDSLIRVAEPMINSVLRVKTMETALAVTVNSSGEAAVPSDYLELKHAYIDGSPVKVLERSNPDAVLRSFPNRSLQNANASRPKVARSATVFIFGPIQAAGDVMKGVYYAKPAASLMADSATIHATFSAYAQVYLFGCAANAEAYIGEDARIQTWAAFFQKSLDLANDDVRREAQSGGALVASTS